MDQVTHLTTKAEIWTSFMRQLHFIIHSCYLWEGEETFLCFDYGEGDPHRLLAHTPSKPLYILCTHSHHDHYTPHLFWDVWR